MKYLLDLLPVIMLSMHLVDKWYLSKGKLWFVYIISIIHCICSISFVYLLYNKLGGEHKGVLVFAIGSTWTVIMSIKGMIRLCMEEKRKIINTPMLECVERKT